MLPTVIVIGAMKCGTRSLYEYLRAHPDVFMSTPKELNYFGFREQMARGQAWYESHFESPEAVAARVRGEASPGYTMFDRAPATARAMHAAVPEVRLVYLVRDPVARIQSHYQHRLRKGERLRPIDEEVFADPGYLQTSSYATQLAPYLERFPREQLLVVVAEALLRDRQRTMRTVYEFVGADPDVEPALLDHEFSRASTKRVPRAGLSRLRRNRRIMRLVRRVPRPMRARVASVTSAPSDAPRLSPATRAALRDALAGEVTALRAIMPPDFDGWGIATPT